MKTGREFLFAIRTTIPNELLNPGLTDEAAEVLDRQFRRFVELLDVHGPSRGRDRDATCYFEGMLQGARLRILRGRREAEKQLREQGRIDANGKIRNLT